MSYDLNNMIDSIREQMNICSIDEDPIRSGELFKEIIKMRHEIFAYDFCNKNNIEYRGDTKIITFVDQELEDKPEKRKLFMGSRLYNDNSLRNKTPDLIYYMEDDDMFLICDFSVRNNSMMSFREKEEKYRPIVESINNFSKSTLIIINYDPIEEEIYMSNSDEAASMMFYNKTFDYRDVIRETEQLRTEKLMNFNGEDLTKFEEVIYSEDRDIFSEGMKINFDFSMMLSEVNIFLEKNKKVVEDIKFSMGERFIEDALRDIEEKSYDSNKEVQRQNWIEDQKNYRDFIMSKSKEGAFKKDIRLKRPTREGIEDSYGNMEKQASKHFDRMVLPKMINFLPVCESEYIDRTDDKSDSKFKRLERFSNIISKCKNINIVRLKEIFKFDQVNYEDYEESKNQDVILTMDEGEFYTMGPRDSVIMKVKNKSNLKELQQGCGYGVKYTDKQNINNGDEKVKSLPFWDKKFLDTIKSETRMIMKNLKDKLIDIGSKKENDKFIEFYIKQAEKFGSANVNQSQESNSSEDEEFKYLSNKGFLGNLKRMVTSSSRMLFKESNEKVPFKDVVDCIKGCLEVLRSHEVMSENLLSNTSKSSKNYKIIQGLSSNQLILVMPHESILMADSELSCYSITISKRPDEVVDLDCIMDFEQTEDGCIYLSKGFKLKKNKIANMNQGCAKFISMLECYNSLLQDNNLGECGPKGITKIFTMVVNININTSAMFDNIRYMVDNSMADLSCCSEYLEEKFLIPCKNRLQMVLYSDTKKLLKVLNKEVEMSRVVDRVIDEEGQIDLSLSRLKGAKFNSIIDSKNSFTKLGSLLQEIQILFFSTPKGLHGKFHNMIKVHRTPLEIQEDINNYKNEKGEGCMNHDKAEEKYRVGFSPKVMRIAAHVIENKCMKSPGSIRAQLNFEGFNENQLRIKTMTSTRSLLIKENNFSPMVNPNEDYTIPGEEYNISKAELQGLSSKVKKARSYRESCRILKSEKRRMRERAFMVVRDDTKRKSVLDFISKIKMTKAKNLIFLSNSTDKTRNVCYNNGIKDFYSSGVVLSEVLKTNMKNKTNNISLGLRAKISVESSQDFVIGVREKGQRTKDDREIFVVNKEMKDSVYVLEHIFKRFSKQLDNEKISIPGDEKIIDLYSQVKKCFTFEINERKKGNKVLIYNMNLDMTKWAPKDNLLKFLPFVCSLSFLKKEEKFFLLCLIIKYYNKKLYIDERIISKIITNIAEGKDYSKSCFYKMLCDEKNERSWKNLADVKETWLQGQLNYPSSAVHSAMMYIFEEIVRLRYPNYKIMMVSNVHSDDNQTTICMSIDESLCGDYDTIGNDLWSLLLDISKPFCIELSIKKSNISRHIKQFVSQYNIAGEQVYLWVKQLMSCVSGLPYIDYKSDLMGMYSKISEACSKGGSERACRSLIMFLSDYVARVYGIIKKNYNCPSKLLNIDEDLLPMCLGGGKDCNMEILAYMGPASIDKCTIMKILRRFGALSIREPGRMPNDEKIINSIKLFMCIEKLSNEIYEEEVYNKGDLSFNPFRPIRFKSKMKRLIDPFFSETKESRVEKAIQEKKENPTILIMKPKDLDGLVSFYNILYLNPTFQSALSGQSPNQLLASRIASRNTGNFRFLKEGDISNIISTHLDEEESKKNMNIERVCEVLKDLMGDMVISLGSVVEFWKRNIGSDSDFQIVHHTISNAERSFVSKRRNPVPFMKPRNIDSNILQNPLSLLLMWWFDHNRFMKDEKVFPFPKNTHRDLIKVSERNPCMFLFLNIESKLDSDKYKGFLLDKSKIKEVNLRDLDKLSTSIIKEEIENRQKLSEVLNSIRDKDDINVKIQKMNCIKNMMEDSLEKQSDEVKRLENKIANHEKTRTSRPYNLIRKKEEIEKKIRYKEEKKLGIEAEVEILVREKEEVCEELFQVSCRPKEGEGIIGKIVDDFEENLPENLLRISRSFPIGAKRVLFCAPTRMKDPSEVVLGLKGQIEGNCSHTVEYSISTETTRYLDSKIRRGAGQEDYMLERLCIILNNVTITLLRITREKSKIKKILISTRYGNVGLLDIIHSNSIKSLSRRAKRCIIAPCVLIGEEEVAKRLLVDLDSISTHWTELETKNNGKFKAYCLGLDMAVHFEGRDKVIEKIKIRVKDKEEPTIAKRFNIIMKKFVSDLYDRKQTYGVYQDIYRSINLLEASGFERQKIYVNVTQNSITNIFKKGETFTISGMEEISIYPGHDEFTEVEEISLNMERMIIEYKRTMEQKEERLPQPYVSSFVGNLTFARHGKDWVYNESITDADLIIENLDFEKVMFSGLWRKLCFDHSRNVSVMELAKVMNTSGPLIRERGPLHTRILFEMVSNEKVLNSSVDDAMEFVENMLMEGDIYLDENTRDFKIAADENQLLMNKRSKTGSILTDYELAKVDNEVQIIDRFEMIEMMNIQMNDDDYVVSYEGIKGYGFEGLVRNSKPIALTMEETAVLAFANLCICCYSKLIPNNEKIDGFMGKNLSNVYKMNVKEIKEAIKYYEVFLMHVNVMNYSGIMDTSMPEYKSKIDSAYNRVMEIMEESSRRIRPEFYPVITLLQNIKLYAENKTASKDQDIENLAGLGRGYLRRIKGEKDKCRDLGTKSRKVKKMGLSSNVTELDILNMKAGMSSHAESGAETDRVADCDRKEIFGQYSKPKPSEWREVGRKKKMRRVEREEMSKSASKLLEREPKKENSRKEETTRHNLYENLQEEIEVHSDLKDSEEVPVDSIDFKRMLENKEIEFSDRENNSDSGESIEDISDFIVSDDD